MTRRGPFPNFGESVLLLAVILVIQTIFSIIVAIIGAIVHDRLLIAHPIMMATMNIIAFSVVIAWVRLKNRAAWKSIVPIAGLNVGCCFAAIISSVGMAILLSEADNIFRSIFPVPKIIVELFSKLADAQHPIAALFCLSIVAPLTEEILFRGIILPSFLTRYSARRAVLLTAFLFAVLHMNPWQTITAFTLGVVLGWFYLRTQNLAYSIIGHAVNNGLFAVSMFLSVEVKGFNSEQTHAGVIFQPWWFDLTGLVVATTGLLLFRHFSRATASPPPIPPMESALDPVLVPVNSPPPLPASQ